MGPSEAQCTLRIMDSGSYFTYCPVRPVSFSSWTRWLSIQHASSPSSRWEWIDLWPQVLSIWHADPSKTRCCEWGDRHILAMWMQLEATGRHQHQCKIPKQSTFTKLTTKEIKIQKNNRQSGKVPFPPKHRSTSMVTDFSIASRRTCTVASSTRSVKASSEH